jgi:hypothetical protein
MPAVYRICVIGHSNKTLELVIRNVPEVSATNPASSFAENYLLSMAMVRGRRTRLLRVEVGIPSGCEKYGGQTGIRTLDTLRYTRFPSVRLQPLGHLSARSRHNPLTLSHGLLESACSEACVAGDFMYDLAPIRVTNRRVQLGFGHTFLRMSD